MARDHDQRHRCRQQAVEQPQLSSVLRVFGLLPVAQAVDRAQRRDQEDRQQKHRGKPVHGDGAPFPAGNLPGQVNRFVIAPAPEIDNARQPKSGTQQRQHHRRPLAAQRLPAGSETGQPAERGGDDPQQHEPFAHDFTHQARADTQASDNTTMTTM